MFGREGDVRQCVGKGGCIGIGLERVVGIGRRFDMNRDIMLRDVSMCGPHSVQKCVFFKMCRRNPEFGKGDKRGKKI